MSHEVLEEIMLLDKQVSSALEKTLRKLERQKEENQLRNSSKCSSRLGRNGEKSFSSSRSSDIKTPEMNYSFNNATGCANKSKTQTIGDDGTNLEFPKHKSDPALGHLSDAKALSSTPPPSKAFMTSTPMQPIKILPSKFSQSKPSNTDPCLDSHTQYANIDTTDVNDAGSSAGLIRSRSPSSSSSTSSTTSSISCGSDAPTEEKFTQLVKEPAPATASERAAITGRSQSVTFMLDSPIKKPEKCVSADSILQDINYLNTFSKKIANGGVPTFDRNLNTTVNSVTEELTKIKNFNQVKKSYNPSQTLLMDTTSSETNQQTGRYSMVDRNLRSVDQTDHVITDLWNISNQKVNLAMVGHMSSCQEEDTVIDCAEIQERTQLRNVDYREALVPLKDRFYESDNSDSGNDTDDLIEDARDFVRVGQNKLVTLDDWEQIDFNRKERRKERAEKRSSHSELHKNSVVSQRHENPFLPRSIHDLKIGDPVKVLSPHGAGVLFGIVRYLGEVEDQEKVGIELKERRGTTNGTYNNKFYFNCDAGFGIFLPITRILSAWKNFDSERL